MDVAQSYPTSCSWTSWCTADNIPHKRKRMRIDSIIHEPTLKYQPAGSGHTWAGVDELTGELSTVQMNGLGVEMQQDYNISDEFLVFDSFSNFKQEIQSPPHATENHLLQQYSPVENVHGKYRNSDQSKPIATSTSPASYSITNCNNITTSNKQHNECQIRNNKDNNNYCVEHAPASTVSCPSPPDALDDIFRFQYVLCAATSIAMKINEETLTYLNQGQPYEIKLKKLGDLTQSRGKVFKSIIRVLFHDRRLQYMERQQMSAWQASRPGDRILQLDLPLSYGIFDHYQDSNAINVVQFLWDPTKEVGIYIKVNCISTEFTAKKHGGEKGVPFRIQIETYSHDKNPKSLHMASCQIKVFKLKGADRKHKQDREKIMKKSPVERENYQNSYECTIFNEMCPNGDPLSPVGGGFTSSVTSSPGNTDIECPASNGNLSVYEYGKNRTDVSPVHECSFSDLDGTYSNIGNITLTRDSTPAEMQQWLRYNRFGAHMSVFENFTVNDMLSLSRDDFMKICGVPDGIRLFNAFPLVTRLTIFISIENNSNYYHPLYLKSLTYEELMNKVAPLVGLAVSQINKGYVLGPFNSHIIITDELVKNIKDEMLYSAEIFKDGNVNPPNKLLLKPISPGNNVPIQQ